MSCSFCSKLSKSTAMLERSASGRFTIDILHACWDEMAVALKVPRDSLGDYIFEKTPGFEQHAVPTAYMVDAFAKIRGLT